MPKIDNAEKLQSWITETDARIGRLKEDFGSSLGLINTQQSEKVVWTREMSEGFGAELHKLKGNPNLKLGWDDMTEKAALGTMLQSDAATGTSAVSIQYINAILAMAAERSELRPLVTKVPMTSRSAVYPKLLTDIEFTYLATQASDVTEANPTFTTITLTVYDYALYIPFTHAFVEDEIIGLGQYLAERTAGGLSKKFDYEFLRGSGSPTTGIMNSTSAKAVTMSGSAFGGVDSEDLIDMIQELNEVQERDGAAWIMHPTILDTIMRITNANGDYKFRDSQVLTRGWTRQILGYPVILSNQMPALSDTAASTAFIALGNPKLFLYGDREALSIKWLADTSYFATNLEELYVAWFRAAFAISLEDSFCVLKTAA